MSVLSSLAERSPWRTTGPIGSMGRITPMVVLIGDPPRRWRDEGGSEAAASRIWASGDASWMHQFPKQSGPAPKAVLAAAA